METGPTSWIERPNIFNGLIFVVSSHHNACSYSDRSRSSTSTINLLEYIRLKDVEILNVSTYLDISKSDVGTCTTGTIHGSCMACTIGEYRSWNEQSSSVIACRVTCCGYFLVWRGESNGCLNKICLFWTKLKNIAIPRGLQKAVQADGNVTSWVWRFTIGIGSTTKWMLKISVNVVNQLWIG